MSTRLSKTTARLAICVGLVLVTAAANAEERKSPLEGQPAIRHRWEMRKGRFEMGPSFGFSINRALRHAILLGAKLEYHINDWISLGADFGYGVNIDTGLTKELEDQCDEGGGTCLGPASTPGTTDDFKAWGEHKDRFSNIQFAGDIRATFTPISGKMGIFSKLFVGYDLYVFAGLGLAMLTNNWDGPSDQDGVTQGFRVGPAFGFGMHLFVTKYFSIGAEIKDLAFSDNQSGGDLTRGLSDNEDPNAATGGIKLDSDDKKFSNHWFAGVNFTFFLPASVEMSD